MDLAGLVNEAASYVQQPVAQRSWFGDGEFAGEQQLLCHTSRSAAHSTISIQAALASKLVNGIRSRPQSLAF